MRSNCVHEPTNPGCDEIFVANENRKAGPNEPVAARDALGLEPLGLELLGLAGVVGGGGVVGAAITVALVGAAVVALVLVRRCG